MNLSLSGSGLRGEAGARPAWAGSHPSNAETCCAAQPDPATSRGLDFFPTQSLPILRCASLA